MRSQRILIVMTTVTAALVVIAVLVRGGAGLQPGSDGSLTGAVGDTAGTGGGGGSAGAGAGGSGGAGGRAADMLVDLTPIADRITAIEVQSTNDTTRIEKRDGVWTVASRDGFPAQAESVVGVLRGMSNLRKSQRLTAKPERHADLGLAWPDAKNESKLVTVYAGSETPVAQVVVGRGVYQPDGVYARLLSEPQTWRCAGTLTVESTPKSWIANPVADVPADSIKSISGCDPTGRTITLTRDDKGGWASDKPSEDAMADGFRTAVPSLLVGMQAEEVRRASPEDSSRPNTVTVTYGLGDSASIHARLWRDGETYFVMLDAALPEPPAATAPAPTPAATPSTAVAPAGTDAAAPAADTVEKSSGEDSTKPPEDALAKLRKQSAAWSGWVFTVPSWRASQLGKLFGDTAPAAAGAPVATGLPVMPMPGGAAPPMVVPPPGNTP